MKGIIITIIAILIVLGIFLLIRPDNTINGPGTETTAEMSEEQNQNTEITEIENGLYVVDTKKSIINWTGKKKILTDWIDTGTIRIQGGEINVEAGAIQNNEISIDMDSIQTDTTGSGSGQNQLTNHLKSSDFFDVANYPVSTFVIKEIRSSAPNQFEAIGDLTIKGVSNEVAIPFTVYTETNQYRLIGAVNIDRTLWDIRFGSDSFFDNLGDNIIDDTIELDFEVFVEKQNEEIQ